MEAELLARIQFAFTIMFHYIFPPFSIGLAALLVIYESMYTITGKKIYEKITRFWIKIFAANFSIGVATGIVMEFEFGTNWATYSRFVGDIFGSPLAAEGIFAFFLESGFLAVLLFGWNRVSRKMHLFSTIMVFTGTLLSGFWIVAANSWMQTPTAYTIVGEGTKQVARITDFWDMVFNPSTVIRFTHTIMGAFLQGGFMVLSVSAYYILKKRHLRFAQRSFVVAMFFMTLSVLAQPILGHEHAKVVAEYQPAKLAAFEGLYKTTKSAPLYILGYTNPNTQETYGLAIPGLLSYLVTGDFNATIPGLDQVPRDEWPNSGIVFQTYHLMVAIGMFLIALLLVSLFLYRKGKLFSNRWLMKIFVASVILPVLANQLGWTSAEVGRQPWIVQGLLKTSDAISKSVTANMILGSIIMFAILYALLFFIWLYVLNREIQHGPEDTHGTTSEIYPQRKDKFEKLSK